MTTARMHYSKATSWLQMADELRALADVTFNPNCERIRRQLADDYEQMARLCERDRFLQPDEGPNGIGALFKRLNGGGID